MEVGSLWCLFGAVLIFPSKSFGSLFVICIKCIKWMHNAEVMPVCVSVCRFYLLIYSHASTHRFWIFGLAPCCNAQVWLELQLLTNRVKILNKKVIINVSNELSSNVQSLTALSDVTVNACYSSPWTLLSYLIISEGVTDLLARYDMFLVSSQKTTAFYYIQFESPEWDNVTTWGKSVVFWRRKFWVLTSVAVIICFRKGVAEP
jgi:hypothetical protein